MTSDLTPEQIAETERIMQLGQGINVNVRKTLIFEDGETITTEPTRMNFSDDEDEGEEDSE